MESLKQLYKIGHGPSSSHTMGPETACKYILANYPTAKKIIAYLFGSLALTGKGHLTDHIILNTLKEKEVEIIFDYKKETKHPNTMSFELFDSENQLIEKLTFISIGGGSIVFESENTSLVPTNVFPFSSFEQIKQYCINNHISLSELVYKYDDSSVKEHLNEVYEVMQNSIKNGLNKEGELPGGLHVLRKAKQLINSKDEFELHDIKELRMVSSYAFAVSEENASGGLIVTAPTCGACGVLPAVLFYLKAKNNLSKERIVDALAVAGIIGNVIKTNASISGAFAGCQSEVGSACSMAAAAVAFLNNQSIEEIEAESVLGVILNYLFRVKDLEEIVSKEMPLHIVEKKIPYMNEAGETVKPEAVNGYKYESLVLDMIHMLDSCLVFEVVREKEFAPIKNATGVDSVESARELLKFNGVEL